MNTTAIELLAELNAYRAIDGLPPFADWRKARHMPMLEAYINARLAEVKDEPVVIEEAKGALAAKVEEVTPAAKQPAYKVLARMSGAKSAIEKPVEFVHAFLSANPDLSRKEAVAALVNEGVNYSTARTQYQKWFSGQPKKAK